MPERHVCIPCGTAVAADGLAWVEIAAVLDLLHALADAAETAECTDCVAVVLRDQAAALAAVAEGMTLAYAAAAGTP